MLVVAASAIWEAAALPSSAWDWSCPGFGSRVGRTSLGIKWSVRVRFAIFVVDGGGGGWVELLADSLMGRDSEV